MTNPLIYDLSFNSLKTLIESWQQPGYRATQIWKGTYQSLWSQPENFSNIPQRLRIKLLTELSFQSLEPVTVLESSDGETQKILFKLTDNHAIETVLMRYQKRRTLCVSTQSGCGMGCTFCATGQMGFIRNLTSGEIVEQVMYFSKDLASKGESVTNIVFMGMGEPFHNYDNVLKAIDTLNHPQGMKLGARRFTISTVGLVPGIRRFAEEDRQVNLAVSLHAADNDLRSTMLPINKKYPLETLMDSLRDYTRTTKRRVTFEWALIQGINDSPKQALKLADLLHGLLAHVNVIPLNPTDGFDGKPTTKANTYQFKQILESSGIPCSVRTRRGVDIKAGCGQLASSK